MRIIEPIALEMVQAHERAVNANVRLGGYDMDKVCPMAEIVSYRAKLEGTDVERLFLLGLTEFAELTNGGTCRVNDLLPRVASHPRVAPIISNQVDLRTRNDLTLLIVSTSQEYGQLVIYDGNHRTMAQWDTFKTVENVPALVSVHPNISRWPFVPPLARW